MANFLKKLFGSSNEAEVRRLNKIVDQVEALEPQMQALTDKELQNKTEEFRSRYRGGETLDQLLPEAYAAMREAVRRVLGQRMFPTQIMGGIVLHQGRIAEMKTGEGQNPYRHAAGVSQRPDRQGRARGHRQRLPGQVPGRVDGQGLPLYGPERWVDLEPNG